MRVLILAIFLQRKPDIPKATHFAPEICGEQAVVYPMKRPENMKVEKQCGLIESQNP